MRNYANGFENQRLQILLLQFGRKRAAAFHVEQAERFAKFWLSPVLLVKSRGFRSNELTELHKIIGANRELLLEKWNEYFSN